MALVIKFICDLSNGVHARPASLVETRCNTFSSTVDWLNTRSTRRGNAKSALVIIGTDTVKGDECQLIISGDDEQQAFAALSTFIVEEFPHCDTPLARVNSVDVQPVPESLSRLNPTLFRGQPVCGGSAGGRLSHLKSLALSDLGPLPAAGSIEEEQALLDKGLLLLVRNIEFRLLDNDGTAGAILEAHRSLATDASLRQHLLDGLLDGLSCAQAVVASGEHFCSRFSESANSYLQERVLDVRDICFQLLQHIYGEARFSAPGQLNAPSVCLAEELTPGQFLELDKTLLKGLLLRSGGTTSHTVILARSFNIPTLVGVDMDALLPWVGQAVHIDGNAGLVVVNPDEAVARYYQQEAWVQAQVHSQQQAWLDKEGQTQDGLRLEVAANIAHSVEAAAAFNNGAQSVGLFRTEMLYMDRPGAPSESELYNIFCQALEPAAGRSIIIRTMDIGGDKPVPYLNIPAENNPFLGYRAVRIYEEYQALFHTQLRAILRASAHGSLKIMIPMISSMEEILWVKDRLAEARQSLRDEHIPFDEKIPLGIMLEVPSVMFIIDQCCEEVDFFSIGSNDLTQYLLAVDRDNAKVTRHYNSLNPAFLRALDYAVQAVHRQGKWIGLCGELGAKGSVLPLLVGLGVDELSMSSPSIPAAKSRLAQLDSRACRQLLNQAMRCRTSLEVEHLLAQFRMTQQDAPLIASQCMTLNSDWRSKEEVIKGMTDNLLLAGRCRYPRKLEADLWAREAVFSTGLGFSFAIPHSKSEHIEQSTISVARLAQPVAWGDDEVQFVIMLTLNKHAAGDQHMRIFSRLARRIMHEAFRNSLVMAQSSDAIAELLHRELEL